jgi:cytochrome P450
VTALKPAFDPLSLSSMAFWSLTAKERDEVFHVLRDQRPVSWHPPADGALMPHDDDPGYWAVVRHADVVSVSRDPALFCSGRGVMYEDVPEFVLEASSSFLAMDAPRHTKLRRLISSAFTPRRVAAIEDQVKHQASLIVDELVEAGDGSEFDFVKEVAHRLPMWTISEMMGVGLEDRVAVTRATDEMAGYNDPEVLAGRQPLELLLESMVTLSTVGRELAGARRAHPADDLVTALVQAEVEGESLTDDEIAAFFVLLSVAGNDTTRNTISLGMKALCEFPDQRRLLVKDLDDRIGPAVEEIVRWATPVMTFRRTATRDAELAGQHIAEGDKVVMFYSSANRDERAFADPWSFDVTRKPNDHVGFGGGGPHFCLGAALARMELKAIFGELLLRCPGLEVGEPEYAVSNFIHDVKRLPCRLG